MWKSIPGWEEFYSINEQGEVRSHARTINRKKGRTGGAIQTFPERLLKPTIDNTGYSRYFLARGGKVKPKYCHVLMWEAFKGSIPHHYQIDHIDGNKLNNDLSNLQCIHRREHERLTVERGQASKRGKHKLTEDQVKEIKHLLEHSPDMTQLEIANKYNISRTAISFIATGRTHADKKKTYKQGYDDGYKAGYDAADADMGF